MKVKVEVFLRKDVFDPQGKAIVNAIHHLGYEGVASVQVGKVFLLEINGDRETVEKQAREIADKLLANPVIENFTLSILSD
ncbi:MAG: phosphoribosylformylglycinamidine synthase subunit PurS [Brevinematales bacterium]|nr:phosphoribosylformylglycinamidine synthase subunit PurS [Brevinematales bacterium]